MAELAVTGSTGRLGGRVARLLAAAGHRQRLVVRDPARAPSATTTVRRAGRSTAHPNGRVTTYTAVAAGDLEHVSGDVERLTGHPPRSLTDVLRPVR